MATDTRGSRILIGCSVRTEQHVFDAYYHSLSVLHAPPRAQLSYAFVADCDLVWPDDALVLPAPQRPADAGYAIDDNTHHWQIGTFDHLARCKQLLLDHAVSNNFTHIFLVDSDLLLETTTLLSLHAADVDVVSGVFYTSWQPDAPPMPQCWLTHPYGMDGLGMAAYQYAEALVDHQLIRVLGGGACCLIKTAVLDKIRYHPRLHLPQHDMWQGEDRTLAVMAQQQHVKQYADAWPKIYHAYRPADRAADNLAAQQELLSAPRQIFAKIGDYVNIRLTPMEDPQLEDGLLPEVRNARGRLGSSMFSQEIEEALLSTAIGDYAIVDIPIVQGHPVYPPGKRAIRLELIDARPD